MQLPEWVQLSEALHCVMGASVSKKRAKLDLCNAVAAQKIRLRIWFIWRPRAQDFLTPRDKPMTQVRSVKKSQIPAILKPGDFNWSRSQIRKPELWVEVQGPRGSFFGNRQVLESVHYSPGDPSPHYLQRGGRSLAYVHRVELHSADLVKVLRTGDKIPDEQASDIPESGGALALGTEEAIKQLWPNGIPKGLRAKDRNKMIVDRLKHNGASIPQDVPRAVQRALKNLKRKLPGIYGISH